MRRVAALLIALGAAAAQAAGLDAGRYHLQSNPWVNLHQRLLYESRFADASPMALDAGQAAAWTRAVDAYRTFVGKRDPIVDRELVAMNGALSADWGEHPPDSIAPAAFRALEEAMPVYRAVQWERDDRVNRFWIEATAPLVASAGEELARAVTKAYGVPFPAHIRVDACSFGWEFGAYTDDNAHVVIAAGEPGNQGFAALEALVHEPSHAIVAPTPAASARSGTPSRRTGRTTSTGRCRARRRCAPS